MRPLYVDINGTTDASGNASIPVAMPRMTGRWHNAKFSLSMSGSAEWAILVNGRPYTYGRGRRVTLGPELIQDGQTATVSVIGGPPKATIDGTATGVSGTPEEILATYTPQPNTIALDTAAPQTLMGTLTQIAGGAAVNLIKQPVPTGTQSIGFVVDNSVFPLNITIQGDQTGFGYVTTVFPNAGPYWFGWDLKDITASFQITPTAGNGCTVDFLASPLVQVAAPNTLLPAPWQAAANYAPIKVTPALNTDFTIVVGAAGAVIRLHAGEYQASSSASWEVTLWDGPSANGGKITDIFFGGTATTPVPFQGSGVPLGTGNGLIGQLNNGSAGASVFGGQRYNQR